jgi:hypothetical protein
MRPLAVTLTWLVVTVALQLTACSMHVSSSPNASPEQHTRKPVDVVHESGGLGKVYEVTLTDGTRCAAVAEGGITCNWAKQ